MMHFEARNEPVSVNRANQDDSWYLDGPVDPYCPRQTLSFDGVTGRQLSSASSHGADQGDLSYLDEPVDPYCPRQTLSFDKALDRQASPASLDGADHGGLPYLDEPVDPYCPRQTLSFGEAPGQRASQAPLDSAGQGDLSYLDEPVDPYCPRQTLSFGGPGSSFEDRGIRAGSEESSLKGFGIDSADVGNSFHSKMESGKADFSGLEAHRQALRSRLVPSGPKFVH